MSFFPTHARIAAVFTGDGFFRQSRPLCLGIRESLPAFSVYNASKDRIMDAKRSITCISSRT
jgi:hypothetical protein